MKIIYHLGLHFTDKDQLVSCLLANADTLAAQGIIVPAPDSYRALLRDTLNATRRAGVSHETQETLLDAVMDQDNAERLVFSNQSFLCTRTRALSEGTLYPMASEKALWMAALFPDHHVEFHFAIRNLATFIPALFEREKELDYNDFIAGIEPHRLRWSEMIDRLRKAVPGAPITVWCDEDTPLIWPEVLGAVSGCAAPAQLAGTTDILSPIMSAEGLRRMTGYLASHPPRTAAQHHRIVAAFLDKYALDDAIEVELDLPGWDAEYVEVLTNAYERDLKAIAQIPDVTLILP